MTDDRTILYKWKNQQEFLKYPHKELVKEVSEKYMLNAAKYEAIHGLVRLSGTNIKSILKKSEKQMGKSQDFEEQLNKFARITENREEISIFSLDPKHISHFNPFYFNNINHYTDGVKNYEEYYKSKMKKGDEDKAIKNNPLKIENASIGFFLALIRESLMKTELVDALIEIIKRRKQYEFIDNEVEEFSAHILTLFINYAVDQEEDIADNLAIDKMKSILDTKKSMFNSLKSEQHYSQLYEAYSNLMKHESNEENKEEQKVNKDNIKKKIDRKKMVDKMKQKALNKMNKKRGKIAKKFGIEAEAHSDIDQTSVISSQEIETLK